MVITRGKGRVEGGIMCVLTGWESANYIFQALLLLLQALLYQGTHGRMKGRTKGRSGFLIPCGF